MIATTHSNSCIIWTQSQKLAVFDLRKFVFLKILTVFKQIEVEGSRLYATTEFKRFELLVYFVWLVFVDFIYERCKILQRMFFSLFVW